MDSIKIFAAKLQKRLTALTGMNAEGAVRNDACCCISLDSRGLSMIGLRRIGNAWRLDFVETVACEADKPLAALSALMQKHDLANVKCSWVLNPGQYQLLQHDALPVKDAEFQAAIRWQIRKSLPFPIEDAFIDKFPIPPAQISNPRNQLMLVVAQQSYIQSIALQIREAGLHLQTIDIQELGLRNITALYENDDATTALLYLRDKASELIVTREKLFYFSRHLEWHFENLDTSTPDNANNYLDRLALEMQRSFDYFQSQWRIPAPNRVLVVSPNPETLDIAAYLSQRIRVQATNVDFSKVIASRKALSAAQANPYLTLLGGALRSEMNHATAG